MIYNTCPHCGANLDPGEKCECSEQKKRAITEEAVTAQMQNSPGKNYQQLYFINF
ncbi:MAG: hypothetical protein IJO09_06525 [Oscillospiraceae bacterium]|nr:hypothetical protein [Oscillospiraceae bacterium]